MLRRTILALLLLAGCSPPPPRVAPAAAPSPAGHAAAPVPDPPSVRAPAPDTPFERSVFYHPNQKRYGSVPAGVEEIALTTPDQLRLAAWFLAPPPDRPLVVYFHGNGGNLSSLGAQFEAFRHARTGVLAVDYRGFGASQGDPSEEGLYVDGVSAYEEAVRRGFPPERIVIYGRSLGGGVATYVARERPCAGLVLESTLTSAQDVARLTRGEKAARMVQGFDSLSRMPDIQVPVLLMHGTIDDVIPCELSQRLHDACPGSELWLVQGAGHNNLRALADETEYVRRLDEFVSGL